MRWACQTPGAVFPQQAAVANSRNTPPRPPRDRKRDHSPPSSHRGHVDYRKSAPLPQAKPICCGPFPPWPLHIVAKGRRHVANHMPAMPHAATSLGDRERRRGWQKHGAQKHGDRKMRVRKGRMSVESPAPEKGKRGKGENGSRRCGWACGRFLGVNFRLFHTHPPKPTPARAARSVNVDACIVNSV